MALHDIGLAIVALVSEVLGTLSGFGSSTFFVPLAQNFESFKLVITLTAMLHVFGNISRLQHYRNEIRWTLILRYGMPSVLFTTIGALLSPQVSGELWKRFLGAGLILFTVGFLIFKRMNMKRSFGVASSSVYTVLLIILMAVSGFLTGLIGTGGALRGLALTILGLPISLFVGISSAIDLGGDLIRLWIYLQNGFMDWRQWFYVPTLMGAAYLGAKLSKALLKRIQPERFYQIVLISVLITGIYLLLS
jgi:uncharacterized membrane protein YfcA